MSAKEDVELVAFVLLVAVLIALVVIDERLQIATLQDEVCGLAVDPSAYDFCEVED